MEFTDAARPDPATTGVGLDHPAAAAGNGFYVPKDIKPKRHRRTKAAMGSVRDAIKAVLEQSHPQALRQVFYPLTVLGVISKNETEYKRTAGRLLTDMREAGKIPFEWIADNTRWMRKPSTFTGIEACLNSTAHFYRRNLWAAMPVYVEVWCEKDALAGGEPGVRAAQTDDQRRAWVGEWEGGEGDENKRQWVKVGGEGGGKRGRRGGGGLGGR